MQFYFPDSQDQVSPFFDFESEEHPPHRVRQRDDLYAHEALQQPPYQGILISKAIIDGSSTKASQYTIAQRQRIYRMGAHRFFRAARGATEMPIMGDCGAFNYADDDEPPYTIDEVVSFYDGLGLDRGVSLDHIVFAYVNHTKRAKSPSADPEWIRRRDLTICLAAEFLHATKNGAVRFEPIGVAHGWDPYSYQLSIKELQAMGYQRIALGGLVPLRTPDLREVVAAAADVRNADIELHLLGVTRTEHIPEFAQFGVTSFDSTSPFRQAFMDERDNYYTLDRTFMALRVPQVDGNAGMKRRIRAGTLDQRTALDAERRCLDTLRAFDRGHASVADSVTALRDYEIIHDTKGKDRSADYHATLEYAPWRECDCGICDRVGIEVVLFRGSERNKRRGFHNLAVFADRLHRTETHASSVQRQ